MNTTCVLLVDDKPHSSSLLICFKQNSWSGRFDIDGFEAHDTGMIIQALANGFWMNRLLQSCRTGEPLALPPGFRPAKVSARLCNPVLRHSCWNLHSF
jgi:hypothetical protein